MDPAQLTSGYPRLFHLAEAGSWPSIRAAGLLTTAQLVTAADPPPEVRAAILGRPRPRSFTLTHPQLGPVVIRRSVPSATTPGT